MPLSARPPDLPAAPMRYIYIIGLPGAGKTTLGTCLAQHYCLPQIEIDALNWGPNWQAAAPEVLLERARTALQAAENGWVADGNYARVRPLLWEAADTIIWLDYPLLVILARLWRRTWQRVFRRIELWNGNRETLRGALFSRDSLFYFVLRVYRQRRRTYSALFAERSNAHAEYLRFRSARELDHWLLSLGIVPQRGKQP